MVLIFFFLIILIVSLLLLFFFASNASKIEISSQTSFECGFSSYFYSRHSFSVHYFLISLIFLFLDLEICFLMPFFSEELNSIKMWFNVTIFISILLGGLLKEWGEKKLEWEF